MRSLGSSDGGVLPAGSPDSRGDIANGPASAHLRTPRLQTHSFILHNHSRQPWSYRITVRSFRSQMYERDSGGSGVSARSVGLFTGLVHLQEFIQPWASRDAKGRFT